MNLFFNNKKYNKKSKKKNEEKPFHRNTNCYKCGGKMTEKETVYQNTRWGGGVKIPEKTTANVCEKCGELTFSSGEAKRLQELSRQY